MPPATAPRPPFSRRHPALGIGLAAVLVATGAIALGADPAAADGMCGPDGSQMLAGDQLTCTFTINDRQLHFHAPAGVSSALVTAEGGSGGPGAPTGTAPGHGGAGESGGMASATLNLTSFPDLYMFIGADGKAPGLGCVSAGGHGGLSGMTLDGEPDEIWTGGQGGQGAAGFCAGGGGGGGTFVFGSAAATPSDNDPLLAAGGGGGGAGGAGTTGENGGQGGGDSVSQPGGGATGGHSGDSGGGAGGAGAEDGSRGSGGDGAAQNGSASGGGGGGGGYLGGGGGGPGGGGGGGCGFNSTATTNCEGGGDDITSDRVTGFHTAQIPSVTVTMTLSNGASPMGSVPNTNNQRNNGHHGNGSGNDPNPNTNPAVPSSRAVSNTVTAACNPRIGVCTVRPPAGPDSQFAVTANGGNSKATLFGTLMGGSKPNCPNYTELNTDWVSFGFLKAQSGSSWQKTAKLTTRHKLSHDGAVALSRKMQICFEAPYQFLTRAGYHLGGHNAVFDGVLPDCTIGSAGKGVAQPCVSARQVLSRKGGWVVRFIFRVPANSKDPKALG